MSIENIDDLYEMFERVEVDESDEDFGLTEWDDRSYDPYEGYEGYGCEDDDGEYWDNSGPDDYDEQDESNLDGFAIWDEDPKYDDADDYNEDWDSDTLFSGNCLYDEDTEDGAWVYEAMDQAWDEWDSGMSII